METYKKLLQLKEKNMKANPKPTIEVNIKKKDKMSLSRFNQCIEKEYNVPFQL